jgi:two-component system NtrC family response regulator
MTILLIDDDINLCKVLAFQLEKKGYTVRTANNGKTGVQLFDENRPQIVITDIQMPDMTGIEVLRQIRRKDKEVLIILITAYGTIENAIEACNLGATDYLTKPFSQEQLFFAIEKALSFKKLQEENLLLRSQLQARSGFENIITRSALMEDLLRNAARVAASEATVLIRGESGTGKELLARAIHTNSRRNGHPMITVNCPSIPDNLMESELFGHKRGAFTGAVSDRIGKFEQAAAGTVFLDEIGDLKPELQAKLLRVLQQKEIEPLGGSRTIPVDVRVIAATNQDLEQLISLGRFREDLYYRLSVVPLVIPPLRDRKEDIPFLLDLFVSRYAKDRRIKLSPEIIPPLQAYGWPGNVRELENIVERMLTLADRPELTFEDLPAHIRHPQTHPLSANAFEGSLQEIEKQAISQTLQKTNGNQSAAARILKIPRHVLLYRLKKYNINISPR